MLNSEIANVTENTNQNINNEAIMNELTNENININTEVKMNTEKKHRMSKIDRQIEIARADLATASEDEIQIVKGYLAILERKKSNKEAENKAKKSDWMTDYRIKKMSNEDIKRMYHHYHEEMLKRELPLD